MSANRSPATTSPTPELASSPRGVLLVCTANICRSPMAEGVLKRRFLRRGIRAAIDSAGTHDYRIGHPPHPMATTAARRRGYDLTGLVARQVRKADFENFDIIVAMDRQNLRALNAIAPPGHRPTICLLLDFSDSHRGEEVVDPHGGSPRDFDAALALIEDGCRGLARCLRPTPFQVGNEDALAA
jgi:protein-tyrosine phosphatase